MTNGPDATYGRCWGWVTDGLGLLIGRAKASGDVAFDFDPVHILRALASVATADSTNDPDRSAKELVDVLVTGLRPGNAV
jgi:hypothetical protein